MNKTPFEDLDISEEDKKLLPRRWQVLGDIIIVSLDEKIEFRKHEIGRALLSYYPRCRTVLHDMGIRGKMRQPAREIIAGTITETIYKENGCLFLLDAMRIMFSKGNLEERRRMSCLGKDEIVIDMFAGIGYFSIPMGVHSKPRKLIAIEINPVAFNYLLKNIKLNKIENIIEPVPGDCSKVIPEGIADRVIMGYLDSNEYLDCGIRAISPGGGVIHYHEAVPEAIENRPVERIIECARRQGKNAEIISVTRIKKYAPGVWHVVVDAKLHQYRILP